MSFNLLVGDFHGCPKTKDQDQHRMEKIGELARNEGVDNVILMGDVETFDSVCRHEPNDTKRGRFKLDLEADIGNLNRNIHTLDQKLKRKNQNTHRIRKFVTLGNHDWERITKFENEVPEVGGVFSTWIKKVYTEAEFLVTEYGDFLNLDEVLYTHCPKICGREVTGVYAEEKVLRNSTKSVVFGHTHRLKLHTEGRFDQPFPLFCLNTGCSLPHQHVEDYAKHSLSNWNWGVCLLESNRGMLKHFEFISSADLYGF